MLKAALAGAFALAVMGSSFALAQTDGSVQRANTTSEAGPVVTNAHIARLKSVLKLNAAQQQYWPPVEAALRDLARQRAALRADAAEVRRVLVVALPLLHSLSDDQKRQALAMARSMGFAVASAL